MNHPKTMEAIDIKEINSPPAKPRVRDKIMRTARDLFYMRGIRAVGVDTIACEAGTNKMSFYRCFGSKDALVAAYLKGQEREAWGWWDETVAAHAGDPRAQVEALFATQLNKVCGHESRGCALANAAVEISEPDHPARAVVEGFKAEMRRRFRALAHEMGARDADALGDSLMLLWEGSYLMRLTFKGEHSPAESAALAARSLMAAYTA